MFFLAAMAVAGTLDELLWRTGLYRQALQPSPQSSDMGDAVLCDGITLLSYLAAGIKRKCQESRDSFPRRWLLPHTKVRKNRIRLSFLMPASQVGLKPRLRIEGNGQTGRGADHLLALFPNVEVVYVPLIKVFPIALAIQESIEPGTACKEVLQR
jgi:hypothetical protein